MSARGWTLFAAVSVVWGMPYLFIKIAVDEMSPGFVAWSRLALAAAVLLPVAIKLGAFRGLRLWPLVVFAIVEMAVPWPLIGFGEQRISSSLTAILIATVPMFVALLALRFDHSERPTPTRFVGLLVGLAGVVALVGIDIGGKSGELLGALAILVAAFGYAIGPMMVKRYFRDADPLGPIAAAVTLATLILLPFGVADMPTELPSGEALASVAVLGLICSAFAFLLFFRLITEIGPSRATVITYVNPIVALALGVAILGEHVTAGAVAGLLLILAGSWLSTDGRVPPGLAAIATRLGRRRRGRPRAAPSAGPRSCAAERPGCLVSVIWWNTDSTVVTDDTNQGREREALDPDRGWTRTDRRDTGRPGGRQGTRLPQRLHGQGERGARRQARGSLRRDRAAPCPRGIRLDFVLTRAQRGQLAREGVRTKLRRVKAGSR